MTDSSALTVNIHSDLKSKERAQLEAAFRVSEIHSKDVFLLHSLNDLVLHEAYHPPNICCPVNSSHRFFTPTSHISLKQKQNEQKRRGLHSVFSPKDLICFVHQICVSLTITATIFESQSNPNMNQKDGNCFQFFFLKGCFIGSWASHSA